MERNKQCPYDKANWLSKITFWWITGLFHIGYKRSLDISDLYDVAKDDEASLCEQKLERCWKEEVQKLSDGKKVSLFRTVFRAFRPSWMFPGIGLFLLETLKIAQPLLLGQVILFFYPDPPMPSHYAYVFAAALGLGNFLQSITNCFYFYHMQHTALKMKVAVAGLIYRKVLTLSCQSFYQTTAGKIVNFLSTDVEVFNNCVECVHYLWLGPIVAAVSIYLIYREVGIACFFSLIPILPMLPLQMFSGKVMGALRLKTASWGDKRIHTMNEIVTGMRVIKMFCWEKPFAKLIESLRAHEMKFLKRSYIVRAFGLSMIFYSSRMMALCIFVGNWLFLSYPITTSSVFVTLGLLEVLKFSVFFYLMFAVQNISQLVASMSRIQEFLLLDEEKDLTRGGILPKQVLQQNDNQNPVAVEIEYMTARWEMSGVELRKKNKKMKKRDSTSETSKLLHESDLEHCFSLKSIALNVKKENAYKSPKEDVYSIDLKPLQGELIAVVGTVGSGKTSLLLTMLGELPYQQGQITLHGTVGYAAQQSWVFSGSVKENILFGDEYDFKRYEAVVDACALHKDIDMMHTGDETLVGERGLFLSGGQKARLTLARAVYRDCDIYLLDDPLSAVDTKVGRHIFHKCIKLLLEEKTVVLVTHQLQYLRRADRIVVLREGSVFDVGPFDELEERGVDLATFLSEEDKHWKDEIVSVTEVEEKKFKLLASSTQHLDKEVNEVGSVGMRVYGQYCQAGYGMILGPILVLLGLAFQENAYKSPKEDVYSIDLKPLQGAVSVSDWMLAKWSETQDPGSGIMINTTNNASTTSMSMLLDNEPRTWNTMPQSLQLYLIFACVFCVLCCLFAINLYQLCGLATQRLHNKLFKYVLGTRTRFFDINPVGSILNRFSRDLGFVDNILGDFYYGILQHVFGIFGSIILVCIIAPWLFLALLPVIVFVLLFRFYAVQTTRDVKRLEATVRSPVYSHISDTIFGLQTIRALRKQDQFRHEFDQHLNRHSSSWFIYLTCFRWYSVRSVFSVVVFFTVVIYVCLALRDSISSGLLSLALVYCTVIMEPFEYMMRASAELENYMTSVERILSYTRLEQEEPMLSDRPPPDTWPMQGTISFSDTSLKYADNLPYSLKHINFHIKSKEKIGIVGRTGAGKSSLLAALLRLTEPEGKIWIDGVDVTIIGLTELRRKISVIPQDPVLFTGTLRRNLDPFDSFNDEELWEVLEQVQLKSKVQEHPAGLYMEMSDSGNNFSVGQRQLVCLARALLTANKILVLDEATAHVDHETDQLIQRVLRAKFRECTVLTIAHRLNTVMDCDRIMVLDEGELKEFDIPYNLLLHTDGYFSKLVDHLGRQQARHLHALAELAYHQRASASILLEEAVKSATEIFRNSREDVRKSKDSLIRSKESLDASLTTLNTIENAKTLYGRYSTPVKYSPRVQRKIRHVKSNPSKESPKVHRRTRSKGDVLVSNNSEMVPLVRDSPVSGNHTSLQQSPDVEDGSGVRVSPIKNQTSPQARGGRTVSPKASGPKPRLITGIYQKPEDGGEDSDEKVIFC